MNQFIIYFFKFKSVKELKKGEFILNYLSWKWHSDTLDALLVVSANSNCNRLWCFFASILKSLSMPLSRVFWEQTLYFLSMWTQLSCEKPCRTILAVFFNGSEQFSYWDRIHFHHVTAVWWTYIHSFPSSLRVFSLPWWKAHIVIKSFMVKTNQYNINDNRSEWF